MDTDAELALAAVVVAGLTLVASTIVSIYSVTFCQRAARAAEESAATARTSAEAARKSADAAVKGVEIAVSRQTPRGTPLSTALADARQR